VLGLSTLKLASLVCAGHSSKRHKLGLFLN
jgi:hypothetical protein